MERLFGVALPFFALILIGYVAARRARRADEALAWLNFFIIHVSLPAVFYQIVSKTPLSQLTAFGFVGATVLASAWAYAVSFAVAWMRLGRMKEAAIAAGIGGYGNVGYMGLGLALAVLGPQAAAPMALVFCFDVILFLTLIPLLVALSEGQASWSGTARLIYDRVILNPFILAMAAGVVGAVLEVRLPDAVERTLDFIKVAAAPAALFALGVSVGQRTAGHVPFETTAALAVKLVIHPILVYLILSLLGIVLGPFDPIFVYTAVLMAALPPAITVFVLASQYGVYVERASSAVLVGTLASIPTLLVWLYVIENRILPPSLFAK